MTWLRHKAALAGAVLVFVLGAVAWFAWRRYRQKHVLMPDDMVLERGLAAARDRAREADHVRDVRVTIARTKNAALREELERVRKIENTMERRRRLAQMVMRL